MRSLLGKEEGRGNRDHAAHAGPGDHRKVLPRHSLTLAGLIPPGQEEAASEQHHWTRNHRDDERTKAEHNDCADAEIVLLDVLQNPAQLQAKQEEDGVFKQELDRVPVDSLGHPGLGILNNRRLVAEDQAGHNDGDHSGGVHLFRRDVGEEGRHEGEQRVAHGVGQALTQQHDHGCDGEPDDGSTACRDEEVHGDRADRDGSCKRQDGGAQGNKGGRVVQERLALKNRHDPAGKTNPPSHSCGGHGVGRGDDGTEGERGGQRNREQPPGQQPDRQHGEEHQGYGEQADRADVRPDINQGCANGRGVQQWRQEAKQHELGSQLDGRNRRDERGDRADNHENKRGGQTESAAEAGHREDRGRQRQNDDRNFHGDECEASCADRRPMEPNTPSYRCEHDGRAVPEPSGKVGTKSPPRRGQAPVASTVAPPPGAPM
mgnify:FL=1